MLRRQGGTVTPVVSGEGNQEGSMTQSVPAVETLEGRLGEGGTQGGALHQKTSRKDA